MKKILIVVGLSLSLMGCAGTRVGSTVSTIADAVSSVTITQNQIDALRSSYNATFLVPAAHYRQLPRCKIDETFAKNQCRQPSIVRQLQSIDKAVYANFNNVQGLLDSGNANGLSAAWSVLEQAVSSAREFMVTNGIGGG